MKVSVKTIIGAPRQVVFEHVVDIARWPEKISQIVSVDILTPGPIEVGTRFRESRIMYGQEASEEMTIAELVPNQKMVLTAENHGTRYRSDHLFGDTDDGTKLIVVFEGKPVSLAARLLAPLGYLMCGSVRKMIATDMADLKTAIEKASEKTV